MSPARALTALAVPSLRDDELENLDDIRLDAMQVDRGRYALLLGFGNDIYFGIETTSRWAL